MLTNSPPSRLLVSIDGVCDVLDIGRSTANRLIYSGELASLVIGRRRLIAVDDLTRFVESRKTAAGALGRDGPLAETADAPPEKGNADTGKTTPASARETRRATARPH